MKSFKIEPDECPKCYYQMDTVRNETDDEKPEPGQTTICYNCAGILQFKDDLKVESAPLSKLIDIKMYDREIWDEMQTIRKRFLKRGRIR